MEIKYGHKLNYYHRVDLHRTLRELAQGEVLNGREQVKIRLASEVAEIDYDNATLTTQDGTRFEKDLLVISDGVKVSRHPSFVLVFDVWLIE